MAIGPHTVMILFIIRAIHLLFTRLTRCRLSRLGFVNNVPSDKVKRGYRILDRRMTLLSSLNSLAQMVFHSVKIKFSLTDSRLFVRTHKSFNALRYGWPALCGNSMAVSTHWRWIILSVFKSLSKACPIRMVFAFINASSDLRIDARVSTALLWFSAVMPENRVM